MMEKEAKSREAIIEEVICRGWERDTARAGSYVDLASEIITDYCNIPEVPAGLTNTWLQMVLDLMRRESYGQAEGLPQRTASVTVGDASVSYDLLQDSDYLNSVLHNYRSRLNRFRKVGF